MRLVTSETPHRRPTSVKYWTIFVEVFPPLYQASFKVDPLDSKLPTLCIQCLIELLENYTQSSVRLALEEQMNIYLLAYHQRSFVVVRPRIIHTVIIYMYSERVAPAEVQNSEELNSAK